MPRQLHLEYPGAIHCVKSTERPLYKAYNQNDATGFIRLNGLRLKVAAKVQNKRK